MSDYLTGGEAARILGISRRTLYRWADEGRIPQAWEWRTDTITPLVGVVTKRPHGPTRNPRSVRYTTGRHSFNEVRNKR